MDTMAIMDTMLVTPAILFSSLICLRMGFYGCLPVCNIPPWSFNQVPIRPDPAYLPRREVIGEGKCLGLAIHVSSFVGECYSEADTEVP